LIKEIIQKRRAAEVKSNDLLQSLIEENKLAEDEIIQNFITLYIAGMETTSLLLTFIVY
jgi:cytochrome P450